MVPLREFPGIAELLQMLSAYRIRRPSWQLGQLCLVATVSYPLLCTFILQGRPSRHPLPVSTITPIRSLKQLARVPPRHQLLPSFLFPKYLWHKAIMIPRHFRHHLDRRPWKIRPV